MSIADMERRKVELIAAISEENGRHTKALEGLRSEYRLAEERVQLLSTGIDEGKLLLASHVIYVGGLYEKAGQDREHCREQAIQRLLKGGGELFTEYCGTKQYAHWVGQHENHTYGYGPRHGSTIFEIGIHRVRREMGAPLNEEEIEAAVYLLRNLERVQAAQLKAKQAVPA